MRRNEIRLAPRRRDTVLGYLLAIIVGALLAAALVRWGDASNWGLQ